MKDHEEFKINIVPQKVFVGIRLYFSANFESQHFCEDDVINKVEEEINKMSVSSSLFKNIKILNHSGIETIYFGEELIGVKLWDLQMKVF